MPDRTDAELVELVRERGDTGAYGQLIRRYQGHAYGLAYSILGDWAEAQDMAQEAFIRAYVNLHTLENPARFPAWLRRIVFSTCMMWMRAFRPELYRSMGEPDEMDGLLGIPDTKTDTPMESTLKNEMSEVVLAAISDLPQKYRIPLTMFHLDGLSYQKVADFLEIPINTVRSLINRARKKLKPALAPYAQEVFPMVKEALNEHKLTDEFAEKILEGMSHQGRWVSYMGALVTAVKYLDDGISDVWLWGGSGYAFSLTVHEELCTSGPYMPVGEFDDLLPHLGLVLEEYAAGPDDEAFTENRKDMFHAARRAIDAGYPLMGWSLRHIDWYPVCGYDKDKNYIFLNDTGEQDTFPYKDLGDRAPGGLALLAVVKLGAPSDDATTVRDALLFGLRTAAGRYSKGMYHSGLAGYDTWIRALQNGSMPANEPNGFGHAFNAAAWAECRRHAVAFLEEASRRLTGSNIGPHLQEATEQYQTVAEYFQQLTTLFPFHPWEEKAMAIRFSNDDLRSKAVSILSKARSAELEGVRTISLIAAKLGGKDTEWLLQEALSAGSTPANR